MRRLTAVPEEYRPNVGIMLLDRQRRVFVGQRIDMPSDAWQMPQGGIDRGETPRGAAWRELKEEVGTNKAEFLAESSGWMTYDLPEALRQSLWKGKWRGQAQKWFAMRFTGEDGDIDIATEHPEFKTWMWAPLDRLVELIVPFKRDIYAAVVAEFQPIIDREF